MVRTPTTRVPSPAFPVRRVNFPAKKGALTAMNVPQGIYKRNLNNPLAPKSKLDQLWPKEALPQW